MKIKDIVPWKSGGRLAVKHERWPLAAFQQDMSRLFEDFFADFPWKNSRWFGEGGATSSFTPRINVEEDDARLTVTAELPGLDDKDIELSLADDSLTISGEKKLERKEQVQGGAYEERSCGSFQRIIPLDVGVDHDKVEASMRKGVLTVILPKLEQERRNIRKVSIRTD